MPPRLLSIEVSWPPCPHRCCVPQLGAKEVWWVLILARFDLRVLCAGGLLGLERLPRCHLTESWRRHNGALPTPGGGASAGEQHHLVRGLSASAFAWNPEKKGEKGVREGRQVQLPMRKCKRWRFILSVLFLTCFQWTQIFTHSFIILSRFTGLYCRLMNPIDLHRNPVENWGGGEVK